MNSADYLGLAAGALTTISFLPQVIKTWKSKSAKDLSFGMFGIFSLGVLLWLIYGITLTASRLSLRMHLRSCCALPSFILS
jgi:MtN3 and saliva related transmembrane protein